MKLRFLWIGETKDSDLRQVEGKYLRRVRRHCGTERAFVPESRKSDPRQVQSGLKKEAALLERKLARDTFLVVLDEAGEEMSSHELADFLQDRLSGGRQDVTFLGGGCVGVPEEVKQRAHKLLSLGRMTLPHELARIVLLEQVYRAFTILKGLPYHR